MLLLLVGLLPALAAPFDPHAPVGRGPGAPSGATTATAGVCSLDFVRGSTGASLGTTGRSGDQVVIGVCGEHPATAEATAGGLVVRLRDTTLGPGLDRQLDTSYFSSSITRVHASARGPDVEVYVALRDGASWSLDTRQAGKVVVVALGAEAAAPSRLHAPSGPTDSVESAGGTWISPAGEVLVPARAEAPLPARSVSTAAFSSSQRVSLDLQDADVRHVLLLLAEQGGFNFVIDDGVTGTVTVRLRDVPWPDALAAILLSKGLAAERIGEVVRIGPVKAG